MLNCPGETGCIQRDFKVLETWDGICALLIAYCLCQNNEWCWIMHASFQTADNDLDFWNNNNVIAKPQTWKLVTTEHGKRRNPNTFKDCQNLCLASNFAGLPCLLLWSVQHCLDTCNCTSHGQCSQWLCFSPSGKVWAPRPVRTTGLMLYLWHVVCHLHIIKEEEGISKLFVITWWREGERESTIFFPVLFGSVLMPKLKQPHTQRKL